MKKLTKKQRHEFYKKLLNHYYRNVYVPRNWMYELCFTINHFIPKNYQYKEPYFVRDHLPELQMVFCEINMPGGPLETTFINGKELDDENRNYLVRATVLMLCIEMTK